LKISTKKNKCERTKNWIIDPDKTTVAIHDGGSNYRSKAIIINESGLNHHGNFAACVAVVAVLQFQNRLYESQKLILYLYLYIYKYKYRHILRVWE